MRIEPIGRDDSRKVMINDFTVDDSISKILYFKLEGGVIADVFDPIEDESFGGEIGRGARFRYHEYSWLIMNIWNERYNYNFNFQLSFSKNN